jgi:hypothetical protein
MKVQASVLGIGLLAVVVAGFSHSTVAFAQEGGAPVLQAIAGPAGGGAPDGAGPAPEALGPAPGGELPAGGAPVGGPVIEGAAPGGPALVEGPALVGGPAPVVAPALVHHFVFVESWKGYGKAHEIRMELLLFVDGTFKMLAPERGYGRHELKMVEWLGGWHLDDDVLMIEYEGHGHNTGFITVAKEGLRLRMNGHRWVDILTVK